MEVASRSAGVQPLSSASAASAEETAVAVEIAASATQEHSDDREATGGIAINDTASDPFAIDSATSALLEFVQSLADGEISGADLAPQQASVLRFLVARPWRRRSQPADAGSVEAAATAAAKPVRKLLHALQADPSPASAARFQAALAPLVSGQLSLESRCRSSQLEEVEALRSIFGGDARELVVYQTHPVTLKVAVQAEEMVDCRVEVGCAMPPDYPEKEALHVCAFVPPPFQGLRIAVDAGFEGGAAQDATTRDGSDGRLVPVEAALQALLERRAAELALDGECAVFTLVEEARAFLVQHSEALRAALVARDGGLAAEGAVATEPQSSSSAASPSSVVVGDAPLQLHPVTLWGRGRIERLESAAIRDVQLACDLPESLARAALREARWDVQDAIAAQHSAAATDATASSSDAMPSSMRPILRQDSLPDRARFALLQEALSPFLSDPQRTLECGACGDTMQLREAAGQICTHLMCVACWRRMLATHIAAGEAFIHCPGYRCDSQVEEGLILALAPTPAHYARYRRWLQNNFIQLRGWRWCSNPRCDRVVATSSETDPSAVVACDCLAQWCLSCGGEGHWPASCAFTRRYGSAPLVTLVRQAEETRPPPPAAATPSTVVFAVEMSLDCKPCPKCATLWFRDGGCDHITCRKCGWNYCMRCLRPYPHQSGCGPEVPMTQLLFTEGGEEGVGGAAFTASDALNTFTDAQGKTHIKIDDVNLIEQLQGGWRSIEESKGQVVELPRFVRREAGHYLVNRRLLRLLRLLESTPLPVASGSSAPAVSSSGSSSSSSSDDGGSADQAELNALLVDLDVGPAQRHTLATLLAFLRQCHGLLHGCCMFLAVHNAQLADSLSSPRLRRSGSRLLAALSQLDYFTRALDETLMPSPGMRRSLRTLARMHGADRPSALKCAVALREALADFRDQVAASGLAGGLEKQLWAELAQIAAAITLTSPTAAEDSKA